MDYLSEAFDLVKVFIAPVTALVLFFALGLIFASGINAREWFKMIFEPFQSVETLGDIFVAVALIAFFLFLTPPVLAVCLMRAILNIKIINREENKNESCDFGR